MLLSPGADTFTHSATLDPQSECVGCGTCFGLEYTELECFGLGCTRFGYEYVKCAESLGQQKNYFQNPSAMSDSTGLSGKCWDVQRPG